MTSTFPNLRDKKNAFYDSFSQYIAFPFFLPSSWLLNHHLNPLTQGQGCKKAPRGSQAWLEHLNMKWTRLGMETARHCESHADPQERGPPINASEDTEFSLPGSLFPSLSLSLFFQLSEYGFTWAARREKRREGWREGVWRKRRRAFE